MGSLWNRSNGLEITGSKYLLEWEGGDFLSPFLGRGLQFSIGPKRLEGLLFSLHRSDDLNTIN